MAAIQFVGFPKITPSKVVKYGYIPRLKGGVDWFLSILERNDNITLLYRMKNAKQAREMAELLVKDGF